ncbi:hypothetical protein M0802_000379 [Mischocyttarus mexicanus]|nr:hypothetical protein M0802_000379 [Mischocyttarus mexicanus]
MDAFRYVGRRTEARALRICNNRIMGLWWELRGYDQLLFASYLRHAGVEHRPTNNRSILSCIYSYNSC